MLNALLLLELTAFGVLAYLLKRQKPKLKPIDEVLTIDDFRTKPIPNNEEEFTGEYLGIDGVSYKLYVNEANALIQRLIKDPNNEYIKKQINEKIKTIEYFESKYPYSLLNKA